MGLNSLQRTNNNIIKNREKKYDEDLLKIEKKIYSAHRAEPLKIELWKNNNLSDKELIIFMPGLGGSINNFEWIGIELSKRGWPVLFIDHKGSNYNSLAEVLEGNEVIPSGADLFLYRLKDLDTILRSHKNGNFELSNESYVLMGHSLGALIAFLYEGNLPKEGLSNRCDIALKDFAVTNLSKMLQCQLNEIPIPEKTNVKKADAIIGFNTFGSIIWPNEKNSGIEMPLLLIGGTYDLITPLISEQFPVFLSTNANPLNRFLIIEGASHFSPIRVDNDNSGDFLNNDLFKIGESFIGASPKSVQNLSLKFIIEFLNNLDKKESFRLIQNERENNLDFYILDRKTIKEFSKN